MPKQDEITKHLSIYEDGLRDAFAVADYQIRRAVAQLEIVETSPMNVYRIRDVASSVLAQLRAYLEQCDAQ